MNIELKCLAIESMCQINIVKQNHKKFIHKFINNELNNKSYIRVFGSNVNIGLIINMISILMF
jgi:hypothetical protein